MLCSSEILVSSRIAERVELKPCWDVFAFSYIGLLGECQAGRVGRIARASLQTQMDS